VIIDANANFVFAALSAKHGIRHRMLSPGADVMESIVDAFERRPRALPEVPSPQPVPMPEINPAQINILAIEDNPVNRLVIEQILESLGVNFLVVATGNEAIAKIAECTPKIVFADVTLPDMEITSFMPRLEPLVKEKGMRPPVIGMISNESPEQRAICKLAGFSDAVAKPLSPEAIDRILRKHLLQVPLSPSSSAKSAA
jgi:CheY-like chemotaxis protein